MPRCPIYVAIMVFATCLLPRDWMAGQDNHEFGVLNSSAMVTGLVRFPV